MVNVGKNQNLVIARMKEKGLNFIINGRVMNLAKPKMNSGKKKNGIGFLFSYLRKITSSTLINVDNTMEKIETIKSYYNVPLPSWWIIL